ncbi:MAG: ubiquinone biosynthesis hydroxylase [Rhizobiales bacterium]|nr:ubiquinone biosynthesis hydroxylase [Hyphomicrobiales bacterium]
MKASSKTKKTSKGQINGQRSDLEYDVLIGGGGYVGLSVAVAIADNAKHLKICIVDMAPEKAVMQDERASAIAADATRMLEQLGLWKNISKDAQAINEMIVTDSKLSDVTRPKFLTFGGVRGGDANSDGFENDKKPFAHMVPNRTLVKELRSKAKALGIQQIFEVGVSSFENEDNCVLVTLSDGQILNTKLLVAADGVRSKLRDYAGIKTIHWPYNQWAIVTTVAHERDHEGRAEEHFLPAGPFAILPLKGKRSSLVWTEKEADAKRLLAMDEFAFELELEQRFGHKLGDIEVDGPRKGFPLGLTLAREFIADRFVLVGDAAHGIHPIAGQGLNLGFKDAAALAQTIVEADRLGLDIGSINILERYQQWRRFDTVQMGVVTDILNRLFSNDNPILRIARNFGLGVVDRLPFIKDNLISQAAGKDESAPNLLRGKAI